VSRDRQLPVLEAMRVVANQALEVAPEIKLLFVTNIQRGELADLGPHGVLNSAQYYTRRQADAIIRSLQDIGLTVESFFDERAFLRALFQDGRPTDKRRVVVFTTAEGGTGSGRRALIPAVCNLLGLPVLNSGPHACSLARHKFHANAVLKRLGVRVPDTWLFTQAGWVAGIEPAAGTRVIVKPTYEGQSVGVREDSVQVVDAAFTDFARHAQRRFGQPALVQEFVSGEEIGVPLVRLEKTYALPPLAVRRANGEAFRDRPKTFRAEHLNRDVSYHLFEPAAADRAALEDAAVLAFDGLEMAGVGRIDFRVDADGRAWAFDTNESPPPLPNTSYAFAMERLGFSVEEMLAVWLGACLLDYGLISRIGPE
jgi:D-alanine-D-alanine ligase